MLTPALWKNVWYQTTHKFIPPITYGKVVKVYDGDTITIASPLPNTIDPIYRFSVRLRDIDSPEIKGVSEYEKELAVIARNALSEKILYKMVVLENIDTEKYGRMLADVFLANETTMAKADTVSISKWMLENKYAVAYNGGTKVRPKTWDTKIEDINDDYYKISTW
jgi:endonuclease YncB( thermonuclease family)